MKYYHKLLICILAIIILAGCVGTPVALDRTQFSKNKINQIEIKVEQEKLGIEKSYAATTGAGVGFGLLGALVGAAVDSGINASRTKSIEDIITAMGNYNFETVFVDKMKLAEPNFSFSDNSKIIIDTNKKPVTGIPLINTSYILSDDRNRIAIIGALNFNQQTEGAKNYGKLYISEHDFRLHGMTEKNKDDKTAFLSTNSELIINILESGMDEIIALFSDDFGQNSLAQAQANETTTLAIPNGLVLSKMKILNEKDNRTLLLSDTGPFLAIAYTSTSLIGKRKPIKEKSK